MHECNAHLCCHYFVTSNPGILQSLPLKQTLSRSFRSHTLRNELVVDNISLAIPSPTNVDIVDIPCPEFLLILQLSNSEQWSLDFHSTFSHCGHSLEVSMLPTPSMAYRVLLVVPFQG
jgi:hypothetical protein